MALTPEDVKTLNAIFKLDQHEFNQRDNVYITERAICDRLEAVDPSWTFELKSIQVRDTDAVVVGSLTINGVTREGVGMQKVMEKAGEAEKGAATDALKRAARLFGVGRYLLSAPDKRQFAPWLAKLANADAPIERSSAPPATTNGGHVWTRDQHNTLALEAQNMGIDPDELLRVLGVTKTSDYAPGFTVAREELEKYAAGRPKTATAPATDLFAGDAD